MLPNPISDAIPSEDPPEMSEVESATCECCGLTEECTPGYIARVRELHVGRWLCGLCAEAVQDEIRRSAIAITTEEAVIRHAVFRSPSPAADPNGEFISAVRQLFRRSFESPRTPRSLPSSPRQDVEGKRGPLPLARAGSSCFPALAS